MPKLTLLLDLDGVCVPFMEQFALDTGIVLPDEYTYSQYHIQIQNYIQHPGVFRNMPLMYGCFETLVKHLHSYDYVVVTSRPPNAHHDTLDWIDAMLPAVEGVIFCDSNQKYRVRGDVIIEDNPTVLAGFGGLPVITIKYAQCYNKYAQSHYTSYGWATIDNILTRLAYTMR